MVTTLIAAIASMALTTGTALGPMDETAHSEWKHSVTMVEDQPTAASIHPAGADKPSVMLQCAGDTMAVIFSVEAIDFEKIEDAKTSRARKWDAKLFVDGEMVDEREWVYLPGVKAAWPGSKLVAAKVFNAAIQGQTVEFELGKRDRTQAYLPEPDAAFADFATDCQSFREAS